ncbi:MAG TPA: DegT/DnrJ/EryC1/StrS family aminotransferase [Fimbriimonadaceae bacterium]|nr:DegT/DnrJ/EryC1/StrS family aminotransferase [Fimbriimonadaceae bacterium]
MLTSAHSSNPGKRRKGAGENPATQRESSRALAVVDLFKVFMSPAAGEAASRTLHSGYIGQGPRVEEFERELGSFLGSNRVATVNSGTSALHLALHLLRHPVGRAPTTDGAEVITTALTCTATNWPILANRLRIRWCDIDPSTLNIDLDDVARNLTPRTKIVMVVHWGGHPVDLDRLSDILEEAERRRGIRVRVIEDCAHGFGSLYKGRAVGSRRNIGCYSFQAIKHVTSIDGGCLVCPDAETYEHAKLLRWYGIDRESPKGDFRCENDVEEWGYKFHMNDVCAAVGLANLRHAGELIARHRANAAYYDEYLAGVPGLRLLRRSHESTSSFWLYSMLVERRAAFMAKLKGQGIITSQVHERNDKHTCARQFRTTLPNLDRWLPELVNIPVGWWVSDEDRERIVNCIRSGW